MSTASQLLVGPPMPRRIVCARCNEPRLIPKTHGRRRYCNSCRKPAAREAGLASRIVTKAVNRGELPPPTDFKCVDCGFRAHLYEHRCYDRPLDVEPVCYSCNVRRGPAKREQPFFLPVLRISSIPLTQTSDAVDCAATTLLVSP